MPAGFDPLGHEDLDAGGLGPRRLFGGGDGHPHLAARIVQGADRLGRWAAEREGDDRYRILDEEAELGRPVVVVESGLTQRRAESFGLHREKVPVGDHGSGSGGPARDEEVDTERSAGQLPRGGDLRS